MDRDVVWNYVMVAMVVMGLGIVAYVAHAERPTPVDPTDPRYIDRHKSSIDALAEEGRGSKRMRYVGAAMTGILASGSAGTQTQVVNKADRIATQQMLIEPPDDRERRVMWTAAAITGLLAGGSTSNPSQIAAEAAAYAAAQAALP